MYVRKVVKSGLTSFTIALPREWAVKHRLEKGDMIYLNETEDGDLKITTKQIPEKKIEDQKTISTEGMDLESMRVEIIASYLNNYQQITVIGDMPGFARIIKETAASLIGLELIEEDSNKIVLRNFVHLADAVPDQVIRRIDNIVRSMIIDIKQVPKSPSMVEVLRERDVSVNRFVFLLFKVIKASLQHPSIASQIKMKPVEALFLWEIALHLEKIGDGIKRASRNMNEFCKLGKNPSETINIIDVFKRCYETTMKSFYLKDIKAADLVQAERDELTETCNNFEDKMKLVPAAAFCGKIKAMLSHVTDISRFARYTR